jgi:hypothetical protein
MTTAATPEAVAVTALSTTLAALLIMLLKKCNTAAGSMQETQCVVNCSKDVVFSIV